MECGSAGRAVQRNENFKRRNTLGKAGRQRRIAGKRVKMNEFGPHKGYTGGRNEESERCFGAVVKCLVGSRIGTLNLCSILLRAGVRSRLAVVTLLQRIIGWPYVYFMYLGRDLFTM